MANNLCSGLYTVNVKDNLGCVANLAIPISNTNGPTSVNINFTNINCSGTCNGAVTAVTPVGGTAPYTYLWIQSGQTTAAISNLCAGVYYLQVTDAKGCSLMDSVIITEPAPFNANQVVNVPSNCGICDGSISLAPSGGTGPYTYLWTPGGQTTTLRNNLCAGLYSVKITDANGCVQHIAIPLNNTDAAGLSLSSTNSKCHGACNGTATVTAVGGVSPFTYLWNDPGAQATAVASGLCAGTWFVTVTGNNVVFPSAQSPARNLLR